MIKGRYEKISEDKIRIIELPIGTGTMPYISLLETFVDGSTDKNGKKIPPVLKDFTSVCTEVAVDITVVFPKGKLAELEAISTDNVNGVEKLLKLSTTISTTNMHMFNHEFKLKKYTNINDIIQDFYEIRLSIYEKRKAYLIKDMENLLRKLSNRARYIQSTLDSTIDMRRKTSAQVKELLTEMKFENIEGDDDFKYLIKMPMDSVTEENVAHIMKERDTTEMELNKLRSTPIEQIWLDELKCLETEYDKYKLKREHIQSGGGGSKPTNKMKPRKIIVVTAGGGNK